MMQLLNIIFHVSLFKQSFEPWKILSSEILLQTKQSRILDSVQKMQQCDQEI